METTESHGEEKSTGYLSIPDSMRAVGVSFLTATQQRTLDSLTDEGLIALSKLLSYRAKMARESGNNSSGSPGEPK